MGTVLLRRIALERTFAVDEYISAQDASVINVRHPVAHRKIWLKSLHLSVPQPAQIARTVPPKFGSLNGTASAIANNSMTVEPRGVDRRVRAARAEPSFLALKGRVTTRSGLLYLKMEQASQIEVLATPLKNVETMLQRTPAIRRGRACLATGPATSVTQACAASVMTLIQAPSGDCEMTG